MKFKINKHKVVLLVVLTILCYSGAALYYYFAPDKKVLYPSVRFSLYDPYTADKLSQEQFESGSYPQASPEERRRCFRELANNLKSAAGKKFDSIDVELMTASVTLDWVCDIENKQVAAEPLSAQGYFLLIYQVKTNNTGVTIEGIQANVDDKNIPLKSVCNEYGYSCGNPFYRDLMAKIKLPEGPEDKLKFAGLSLGVWSHFDANRLKHSRIEIPNIWHKPGTRLIDSQLQKMNIALSIKKLQYVDTNHNRYIDIQYQAPYYKRLMFEIVQGNRVFSFPSKNTILAGKGVYRVVDRFDFDSTAKLVVKVIGWEPTDKCELKLVNSKGD